MQILPQNPWKCRSKPSKRRLGAIEDHGDVDIRSYSSGKWYTRAPNHGSTARACVVEGGTPVVDRLLDAFMAIVMDVC
jgi:hypothetical protein